MKRHVTLLTLFLCCLTSFTASAQRFKKKSRYSAIGVSLNSINYVGELDPGQSFMSPALKFTRLNVGADLTHRFTPRITGRAAFSWGRLRGDDATSTSPTGDDIYRRIRNLHFRNDLYELKFDGIVDLIENRRGLERRAQYTPFAFLGVAGFYHSPKAEYGGEWIDLQPLGTEGQYTDGVGVEKPYSKYQISVPFGLGFRYKIGYIWDLSFEIGWRKTFTDYLDDVSTTYVHRNSLTGLSRELSDRSKEITWSEDDLPANISRREVNGENWYNGYGNTGDQRGDSNTDWYIITGFHLTYIFHPKVICPKFRG